MKRRGYTTFDGESLPRSHQRRTMVPSFASGQNHYWVKSSESSNHLGNVNTNDVCSFLRMETSDPICEGIYSGLICRKRSAEHRDQLDFYRLSIGDLRLGS